MRRQRAGTGPRDAGHRRGIRWEMLAVPLVVAAAALVGALFARPLPAALAGVVLGIGLVAALLTVEARRLRRVAEQIRAIERGESDRVELSGGPHWRRLDRALDLLARSLSRRIERLAGERSRVQQLLDELPSAVLLFADDGLVYANPTACALFELPGGLSPERGERQTPLQVLGVEGLAGAVAEAHETGRPVEVEVNRVGRELIARASVTDDGQVALVVRDRTDARRLEVMRRDFVTNASHELKTPVAGIQALADSLALAAQRDPDRAVVMVGRLQREAVRLGRLVRDLLDLSRLEEESAQRARRAVDLAEIARVQVERLRPLAAERSISMWCAIEGTAQVVATEDDLRLIVDNLLRNAVQYNRVGGTVWVNVTRVNGTAVLEVGDNGIGIPASDRDRVFERFYRVDKARSRAAGGTGLGLSIVRHAAQRHGGDVDLRTVLGEGSVFRVVLPVEGSTTS